MKLNILLLWVIGTCGISANANSMEQENNADPAIPELQIGVGIGSGSVNDSSFNSSADFGLDVRYFSEHVTFRDNALFIGGRPLLGETALPTDPTVQLSLQLQSRFDPRYGRDEGDLSGLQKRDAALEAGINMRASYANGYFEGRVLQDVSDTHGGFEIGMRYVHRLSGNNWTAKPWIGGFYHDSDLLNYYFGVTADDQCRKCTLYTIDDSAFSVGAGFELDYEIRERWVASLKTTLHSFNDQITDSPTYLNENIAITGAVSVRYRF